MRALALLLILFSLLLAGCGPRVDSRPLDELMAVEKDVTYHVRPGDTLDVQVWGEAKLSGEVFVRDDGFFSMPLVNDVAATGKSLNEIQVSVTKSLKRFVPAASVSLNLIQSAPIKYYLLGNFIKPGEYRSEGTITFLQAIASGGGFAPFANEGSITLIRKAKDEEFRYTMSYNKVVAGVQPNPPLKHGDVIAVK